MKIKHVRNDFMGQKQPAIFVMNIIYTSKIDLIAYHADRDQTTRVVGDLHIMNAIPYSVFVPTLSFSKLHVFFFFFLVMTLNILQSETNELMMLK